MSIWDELRKAFDEGRDEEEHGASTSSFVDLMLLAAGADRIVDEEEVGRVTALLTGHWRAYSGADPDEVASVIAASRARLAVKDQAELFDDVTRALRDRGVRATEEGYSLAYAVLLAAGGVTEVERSFADRLRTALALDEGTVRRLEAKLDAAARV